MSEPCRVPTLECLLWKEAFPLCGSITVAETGYYFSGMAIIHSEPVHQTFETQENYELMLASWTYTRYGGSFFFLIHSQKLSILFERWDQISWRGNKKI